MERNCRKQPKTNGKIFMGTCGLRPELIITVRFKRDVALNIS